MKRLVVTADDFGSAVEVNEAVELAHREGVLTAASLMVGGPAAGDAVARARAMPTLGIGLHLVLLDGEPVLPAQYVPDLVDARGRFRRGPVGTGFAALLPRVRQQLSDEITAQFAAFAATGLPLDHVNSHRHFHVHPVVATLVLRQGRGFGMHALRAPLEPHTVLAQIEPGSEDSRCEAPFEAIFATRLRHRALKSNIITPDAVFGLAWSGRMRPSRLRGLVANLPDGLSEIYLHPASRGDFAGAVPGYRYVEELQALVDPGVAQVVRASRLAVGPFRDFVR